ncbi:hypothetical protein [Cupriavidus pauculus]|uniref:hypothetical protein n=1 Tax=Cupriavidus pauculus TaxID=82633 RepID=UPI001FD48415|nr:hypothetical protein [Cupriavidus pauculus]
MYEIMSRAAVREQGAEAFRRGNAAVDNPYMPGTDAHLEWNAGYKDEKYKPTRQQA